jgi:hypothetical protein
MEKPVKTNCLSCKYYKIKDAKTGLCRMEALTSGNREAKKPEVEADYHCDKWIDCGQTYYIRLGWIKKNSPDTSEE